MAFNTGFGALVGMGVDAMNGGRTTLYSRAPAAKTARLEVVRLRF